MKKSILSMLVMFSIALCVSAAWAKDDHGEKEKKEDIARHRAIATAHEAAAKCLESGKKEDVCLNELRDSCKGLAYGKFCGMKHAH